MSAPQSAYMTVNTASMRYEPHLAFFTSMLARTRLSAISAHLASSSSSRSAAFVTAPRTVTFLPATRAKMSSSAPQQAAQGPPPKFDRTPVPENPLGQNVFVKTAG